MRLVLIADEYKKEFIEIFGKHINKGKLSYELYDFMAPINNMISNITNIDYDAIAKSDNILTNENMYDQVSLLKHDFYRVSSFMLRSRLMYLMKEHLKRSSFMLIYNIQELSPVEVVEHNLKIIIINNSESDKIPSINNTDVIDIKNISKPEKIKKITNYIKENKDEFSRK